MKKCISATLQLVVLMRSEQKILFWNVTFLDNKRSIFLPFSRYRQLQGLEYLSQGKQRFDLKESNCLFPQEYF